MIDDLKKYSVLFIEDEDEIRSNYSEYLSKFVGVIYDACDGESGFEYYTKYAPDIILIDINLPKLNGLELAKKIRLSDKIVRIIVITAYSDTDKLLKAIELQLTKYILKPISRVDLKDSLLKAIQELNEIRDSEFINKNILKFSKGCFWNKNKLHLTNNEYEVKLTKNEIKLLSLLSSNKIFSNQDIFENVWDDDFDKDFSIDSIKTLVKNIRKKLPENTIINIYGEGYRLNPCVFN